MSKESQPQTRELTGKYIYIVLCVACLGLLAMLQLSNSETSLSQELNFPVDSFLVLAILALGGLGVAGIVRSAPLLILLMMALPYLIGPITEGLGLAKVRLSGRSVFDPKFVVPISFRDTLSAAALLGFTIGHFRIQSLTDSAFPIDERLKRTSPRELKKPYKKRKPKTFQRTQGLVSPAEVGTVLLGVPASAALAQLFWWFAAVKEPVLELHAFTVRFVLVGWSLLVPGLVIAGIFRLWRQNTISAEKARLITQDVLWQETRREQRRISQWLVWMKLKKSQREDTR